MSNGFLKTVRKILRRILLGLLANSAAIFAVTQIFPDRIAINSTPLWKGFVIAGFVIGILNTFLKPLLKILSLPLVILTMGLFLIVINAAILWFLNWIFAGILLPLDVTIDVSGGAMSFVILGVSLAVLNGFLHWLLKE